MTRSNKGIVHRIIYALCAFLLMVIDWTRGSQVGSTWAWTVNMMGVIIVFILIFADGMKHYLQKKYAIWSCVMIAMLMTSYFWWQNHQVFIYRDKLITAVCNIWFIGICVLRLLEFDLKMYLLPKMMRNKLVLCASALFLLMFISKNEDIWPGWFLTLFIVVYCWQINEVEKKLLTNGLIDGILASFFVLQGAAFVFRHFDGDDYRYCGIYNNTNMNALFYCIILVAFLIRLYQLRKEEASFLKRMLCFLFAAAMVGFSVLTVCKTAWVTEALLLALYGIVVDIKCLKKTASWLLIRIVLFALVIVVSIPIDYIPVRYLPSVFHHPIWYEGEYAEWRVHSWDPIDSEKYVSFEEVMGAVSGRLKPIAEKLFSDTMNLSYVHAEEDFRDPYGIHVGPWFFPFANESTFTYSSYLGRLGAWYYYFTHGTLLGHSNLDGHYIGIGISYIWHAQNVFLQIWYYYGIPAGILFLVVAFGALVRSVQKAWANGDQMGETAVFVMMFMSLFLLFGLFEAVWYPGQMILTLAVFAPKLMLDEETSTQ